MEDCAISTVISADVSDQKIDLYRGMSTTDGTSLVDDIDTTLPFCGVDVLERIGDNNNTVDRIGSGVADEQNDFALTSEVPSITSSPIGQRGCLCVKLGGRQIFAMVLEWRSFQQ